MRYKIIKEKLEAKIKIRKIRSKKNLKAKIESKI